MKQNDWIVAKINNPEYDAQDFKYISDLTLDNTQFLPKNAYIDSDLVTKNKQFQNDKGEFKESLFDTFYAKAASDFQDFSAENEIDDYQYSMWDVRRPKNGKVKDIGFTLETVKNPDHNRVGAYGFNQITPSGKSRRELAQNSRIYDPATNTWSEDTVNDISLFSQPLKYIKSLFDEPLVYATYDEDTTEIDPHTGKEVVHQKGEWKVNEDGEYYTERLNGRSLVGKSVVSAADYLTSEDSAINKYDAFDSDDLDKSITGTIVKNLAAYAPVLIPGVGTAYAGLMVGREIGKSLPMLYGMVTGLAGAEDTDSQLLNNIAAYGQKFTGSTSDYSQENAFTFENIGSLMSDVALQWGQQKFIAETFSKLTSGGERAVQTAYVKAQADYAQKVTKALEKASKGEMPLDKLATYVGTSNFVSIKDDLIKTGKWLESVAGQRAKRKYIEPAQQILSKRIQTGQDLSLVYMAIISNTDVYESVLEHGGTPFEAAAIALGSTIGMFGVDKYAHLGEVFFNEDTARKAIRTVAVKNVNDLRNQLGWKEAIDTTTKKGIVGLIQKGISAGKKTANEIGDKLKEHTLGFAGKALGEGVEEVAEEVVADLSKTLGQLAGQLGYFSQTDYGAWDNMLERYGMSLLGGAAGGGLFYTKYAIDNRGKNNQAFQNDLIYLLRNGKKDQVLAELAKMRDNKQLGSTTLSVDMVTDDKGDKVPLTADENHQSQADYIYNTLISNINQLDVILNGHGLRLTEDELFDKMTQGDFRAGSLQQFLTDNKQLSYITNYQQDVQNLANQIINKEKEIQDYIASTPDAAKKGSSEFKEKLDKLKQEQQKLEEEKEYLFGEGSLGYVEKMLLAMDLGVSGPLVSLSKEQFSKNNLGKELKDLTASEKATVDKQFEEYSKNTKKTSLDQAWKLFKAMQKKVNPAVQELNKLDLTKSIEDFKKLVEEEPYSKQKGRYDLLDGETEEDIAKLQRQEGEGEEAYQKRLQERDQKVEQYNNAHIKEWVDKFADLPLDRHSLRMLHSKIGALKSEIIKGIVSQFVIPKESALTLSIREALEKGESDKDIEKVIRKYYIDKYKSKYGDLPQIPQTTTFINLNRLLQVLQGNSSRGEDGDYLTQGDIYTLLDDYLKKNNITLEKGAEWMATNLAPLSANFLDYLHNTLQENIEDIQKEGEDYAQIIIDIPLQEKFLQKGVDWAVNKAFAEVNETDLVENEETGNETTPVTVSDVLWNNLVQTSTEETLGNSQDLIDKIRKEIENNEDIRIFNKLESKKFAENPALSVVNQINDSESFLESIYELYQKGSDEFSLSPEQIEKLKSLAHDMEVAKAFIKAASVEESFDEPIGHNKFLNDYVKRHSDVFKNWEELPEVNADTAYLLINELDSYQQEMQSWINLSFKNDGNQLKALIGSKTALQKTTCDLYTKNRKAFKITPDCDLLEGIDDLTLDGSFQAMVSVESLLHNNYLKALNKGITLEQILDVVVPNLCHLDRLNKQEHTPLDENLKYEVYSDYDKLMAVVSNFAISDKDFYSKLLDTINKNGNFVPIQIQAQVLKLTLAHSQNLDLINRALRYVNSKVEVKLPVMPNLTIVTGVAGAGKSFIISTIANNDGTTWISGPTQNQIDKLSENLTKAAPITKEDLLKKILGSNYAEFIKEVETISSGTSGKFFNYKTGLKEAATLELKEGVTFNKIDNAPKELIIDEAAHFSTGEMLAITHWAEQNGVHVTAIAGNTQNGYHNKANKIGNITSEVCLAWRTPNLFISLRTNNSQKTYDLKLLDTILERLDAADTNERSAKAIEELKAVGVILHYYDGSTFAGDQITTTLGDVSKFKGSVAFIGNESSKNYKKLQDAGLHPDIINPVNVQGQEYDYVVVDKTWDFEGKPYQQFLGLKDLYTMISRSKKGTVIIKNNLPDWIASKRDDYTSEYNTIAKALPIFRKATLEELNNTKFPEEPKLTPPKVDKGSESKEPENKESEAGHTEEPSLEPTELTDDKAPIKDNKKENIPEQQKAQQEERHADMKPLSGEGLLGNYPVRVYGNVSYSGIKMEEQKVDGKSVSVWSNEAGSNADLGIFIGKNDAPISDSKEQDKWVNRLIQLKCLFHYGTSYYTSADDAIKRRFSKENLDNAKFFIKIEQANDQNLLVGLTDLKNEGRSIGNGRIVKLIAEFQDKRGITYELSLGAFADPKTWKANQEYIEEQIQKEIESGKGDITALKEYKNNLGALIDAYSSWIENNTTKDQKIEIEKPNFSQLTSFIHRDSILRLESADPNPSDSWSPYKYASHYSVNSPAYVITNAEELGLNPNLQGKNAVMFSSSNIFLSPSQLRDRYLEQKRSGTPGEVRMMVLDNLGVSFRSLYDENYKGIYTTEHEFTPFKQAAMGARIYIAAWNFRANLKQFNKAVKAFRETNPDLDLHHICELDNKYYRDLRKSDGVTQENGKKYLSEKDYRDLARKKIPENDLRILELLWNFNDSLGEKVREFRLGYNRDNGAYIRKLTGLKEGGFYADPNNTVGIYINPEIAQFYEQVMDNLFKNIYDKIITCTKEANVQLDPDKVLQKDSLRKNKGWFKIAKKKGTISIELADPVPGAFDTDSTTLDFSGGDTLAFLTSATIRIGKYLAYERFYPDFTKYISERSEEDQRYRIKLDNEELDWISIIPNEEDLPEGISLVYADPEGDFTEADAAVGVKPYSIKTVEVDGKEVQKGVGVVDSKIDNMFSLMFHGLIDLQTPNDFTKSDIRATDALFKYGFKADPLLVELKGDKGAIAEIISSKFVGTDVICGLPIINVYLSQKTKQDQTTPVDDKPLEGQKVNPLEAKNSELSALTGLPKIDLSFEESEEELLEDYIGGMKAEMAKYFINQKLSTDSHIYYNGEFKTLGEVLSLKSIEYKGPGFEAVDSDDKIYNITWNELDKELIIEPVKKEITSIATEDFRKEIEEWLQQAIYKNDNSGVDEDEESISEAITEELNDAFDGVGENIGKDDSDRIISRLQNYLDNEIGINQKIITMSVSFKDGAKTLDDMRIKC